MNPSVEEVADEDYRTSSEPHTNGNGNQLSLEEVVSRHEEVLSEHLRMLKSLKIDQRDRDACWFVDTTVNRTVKMMTQLTGVKIMMMKRNNPFADLPNTSSLRTSDTQGTSNNPGDSKQPKQMKKRARISDSSATNPEPETLEPATASTTSKRKRTGRSRPDDDEDVRNVAPVSMETEDISEEVNRRLRIKEERRKKKDSRPEKRKRESLDSNESTSPRRTAKPKAKKVKVKAEVDDEEVSAGSVARKRESDRPNLGDRRGSKRQKWELPDA